MIRPTLAEDTPALKRVIDATGLFPSEWLDDMLAPYLSLAPSEDVWLTSDDVAVSGLLYCAPERMTEGTWNMLLIAVDPSAQGKGIGGALNARLETILVERGARILLVETSGLPEFEPTRRFYHGKGYTEEARIRDFYRKGEGKIVFRKALR